MAGEAEGGSEEANGAVGWKEWMAGEYRRLREHAETYPYVWASYIVVYGGLGAYMAYRWRKLRRTEDRVRVLQQRLRRLVEAEEAAARPAGPPPSNSASPPTDKPMDPPVG